MRITVFRRALCALAIVTAAAPAVAGSCVAGSLASYVALGATGCTIDSLTFSDFVVDAFPGPTAQQIAPGALAVSLLSNGFSLSSGSALSASAGDLFGLRLLFSVHAPSLTGGTVAFGSNRSAGGDGALTALLDVGAAGNAIALVIDGFDDAAESFTSAATSTYAAFLELGIDGGTSGSAALGPELAALTFTAGTVSPVPEPGIGLLTLSGLIVLLARRRRSLRVRRLAAPILLMACAGVAQASSHREAPIVALDQKADITDLYAFRSYDGSAAPRVTLILNVDPFLEPANGPNWFPFDPDILYEIKIDNDNDASEDVVFQFRFTTEQRAPGLFQAYVGVGTGLLAPGNSPPPVAPGTLVVPPHIASFDSPGLGQRQSYTVTMIRNGVATPILNSTGGPLYAVPANVGPRTMNYQALFAQATYSTNIAGVKVFSGTVDDPFFIDLGAAFDTANFRAGAGSGVLSPAQDAGSQNVASDALSGYSVNSIAIEVPVAMLTRTGNVETASSAAATIGVWGTTSRPRTTLRRSPLPAVSSGTFAQIQRLGNPLVNELLIGTGSKDRFSMDAPKNDGQFSAFVLDPALARVLNAVYGMAIPTPPRTDLLALVTYAPPIAAPGTPPGPVADMLRLNTGVSPTPIGSASRLGLLGGDGAGYPNGRRLFDDVVDISLRVVAGVLAPGFNVAPNNRLGDGVNVNDVPFRTTFPYLGDAQDGRNRRHIDPGESGCTQGGGSACPVN